MGIKNHSIGFVPTMGNLHEGHVSLIQQSKQQNDKTVLSIFINPTQFNNADDFNRYPKTVEQDKALAKKHGVDEIILPDYNLLYPDNYNYKITECNISKILEGQYRPGHFDGVLTVVLKLLLIIKPTRAYFGEKDYQQLVLVKNMVKSFFVETDIVGCPTVRNKQGLPLSSRNSLLTPEQYKQANYFPAIFHNKNLSCQEITEKLKRAGFEVDYIEDYNNRRFAAVKIGNIRLIDNIELKGTGG